MLPVNLLGDAAAAEAMVKQATRINRPDQVAQDEIFERRLQQCMEMHRLASVRPTPKPNEYQSISGEHEHSFQREKRRHRRYKFISVNRDQPKVAHQFYYQPLLFDLQPDRVVDGYHKTDRDADLGHAVDRII